MSAPELRLKVDTAEMSARVKRNRRVLHGEHTVELEEMYPPEFMSQWAKRFRTIAELVENSPVEMSGDRSPEMLDTSDGKLWEDYIAEETHFSSWRQMVDQAALEWTFAQLQAENPHQPNGSSPSSASPSTAVATAPPKPKDEDSSAPARMTGPISPLDLLRRFTKRNNLPEDPTKWSADDHKRFHGEYRKHKFKERHPQWYPESVALAPDGSTQVIDRNDLAWVKDGQFEQQPQAVAWYWGRDTPPAPKPVPKPPAPEEPEKPVVQPVPQPPVVAEQPQPVPQAAPIQPAPTYGNWKLKLRGFLLAPLDYVFGTVGDTMLAPFGHQPVSTVGKAVADSYRQQKQAGADTPLAAGRAVIQTLILPPAQYVVGKAAVGGDLFLYVFDHTAGEAIRISGADLALLGAPLNNYDFGQSQSGARAELAVTLLGNAGVSKIRLFYGGTSVLVSDFTGLDQAFMGAMNEDYLTGEKIDDHTAGQLIFLGMTEAGAMVKIPARVALTRYKLIGPGTAKSAKGKQKGVKPASEAPGEPDAAGMKPKDAPENTLRGEDASTPQVPEKGEVGNGADGQTSRPVDVPDSNASKPNIVESELKVTAEATIDGHPDAFIDTNQKARVGGNPDQPTLIAERVAKKRKKSKEDLPNGNMADAHAEIGAIQQAFAANLTHGRHMTLVVKGKEVCGYCRGDIPAMAAAAGLQSLTVIDEVAKKTYYWTPGKKSLW